MSFIPRYAPIDVGCSPGLKILQMILNSKTTHEKNLYRIYLYLLTFQIFYHSAAELIDAEKKINFSISTKEDNEENLSIANVSDSLFIETKFYLFFSHSSTDCFNHSKLLFKTLNKQVLHRRKRKWCEIIENSHEKKHQTLQDVCSSLFSTFFTAGAPSKQMDFEMMIIFMEMMITRFKALKMSEEIILLKAQ